MTDAMIAIENLTRRFGPILAVDDVSFSVGKGDVVGLLGPNGAGKSTAMKMVTGFLPPSNGRARICGIDVQERPVAASARFGYLPEGAPSYPDMTPAGFLTFVAELRGLPARRSVAAAAAKTGLDEVMRQPIDTLSKGYRCRVGLAAALLHDPDVLILDEPTDGLDPNQRYQIRRLIEQMAPDKAIIICTHILEEVEAVCSRAIIIARGRLLADDTPAGLAARSASGRLDEVFRAITLDGRHPGAAEA